VKKFKRPAENQELILSVFEEEGWPETIDDPLSATSGVCSRRRLVEAVKRLNRHQEQPLIRFSADTTHARIYWGSR
jgi:hypothetical protein